LSLGFRDCGLRDIDLCCVVWGLEFGVWGLEFMFERWGLEFGVWVLVFADWHVGYGVYDVGFSI